MVSRDRDPRPVGHPLHPPGHRPHLHRHQAHDLRRVRGVLVAQLPRPVLLLQGHRGRLPRGQPPPVRVPRVLPPLDAVLAVEHREGGVDLLRSRPRQLRRGPDPPPPAARLSRGRARPARHRRTPTTHHRAVRRVARHGLRPAATVVERLDPRTGHQGRGHRRDAGRRGGGGQQGRGLLRGRPGHLGVGHVGARLRRPAVRAGWFRVRGGAREVARPVPQRLPGRAVPPVAVGGRQRPGAHRLRRGHVAPRVVRRRPCRACCDCPGTSSRCRTSPTPPPTRSCS